MLPIHPRIVRWARAGRARLVRTTIALAPRAALALWHLAPSELGLVGEELAARALADAGWRVLGRRVATPAGEVDVVARRGELLAAVEVKAGRVSGPDPLWRPPLWSPATRVDAERLGRQRQAARWLAACLGAGRARVDVVEIWVLGRRARVLHHADVSEPLGRAPRPADRPWLPGAPGAGESPGDGPGWTERPVV